MGGNCWEFLGIPRNSQKTGNLFRKAELIFWWRNEVSEVNNGRIAWVSYTQEIRTFFASNIKFGISLNKVYVSKNVLIIFVLLFIDSFQVASDFWGEET